jgi:hypothetical protein
LKERIATAAERAGFTAEVESVADHGRRRTDVLIHGDGGFLLGCEAQISYATAESVRKRSEIARVDGITPMWTTNDESAQLIDQAPWTRIDDVPPEIISAGTSLVVRGGVKVLQMLRCDQRGIPCPDRRRGCTKPHGTWGAPIGLQLDDAIVRAAAQDLVPIQVPRDKRRVFWMWVSKSDRDLYLDSKSESSEATTEQGVAPGLDGKDATQREIDWKCGYGKDSGIRAERSTPRDTGALIDAPSITARSMPEAPPRVVLRPRHCGALADPSDPARHCGEVADLFPCGWRCPKHRPGAS